MRRAAAWTLGALLVVPTLVWLVASLPLALAWRAVAALWPPKPAASLPPLHVVPQPPQTPPVRPLHCGAVRVTSDPWWFVERDDWQEHKS